MWKCKNCSEQLEDSFDACWSCGYFRDGTPPRTATDATDDEPAEEALPTGEPLSIRPSASPLSEVLAYNNSDVVWRIARDNQFTTEEAESVFRDTIRFLYLAGATDAKHIAPTKNIDKGWHSFLMFTRDYAELCRAYFGRFIHHEPRRPGDAPPEVNNLAITFDLARQFFGPSLSKNWNYDIHATADCQKCTSSCSPDTGGRGSECTPDGGD